MGTFGKRLTLALGVAAGAALTIFAISKSGNKDIKKITAKTIDLKDELLSTIEKDFAKIKQRTREFI